MALRGSAQLAARLRSLSQLGEIHLTRSGSTTTYGNKQVVRISQLVGVSQVFVELHLVMQRMNYFCKMPCGGYHGKYCTCTTNRSAPATGSQLPVAKRHLRSAFAPLRVWYVYTHWAASLYLAT